MPIEFVESFEPVDPTAVATFQRTFQHVDWVDGVSIIQAEENGAEAGFNARFRRIENDLDGVGRDAAQALRALAEARLQLRNVIEEIKDVVQDVDKPHGDKWEDVPLPTNGWNKATPPDGGAAFNPVGYFKDRTGMIHLRGVVTTTQAPSDAGLPLFTLKPEWVPESRMVLGAFSGAGSTRVEVMPTGAVVVKGAFGNLLSLDGMLFRGKRI